METVISMQRASCILEDVAKQCGDSSDRVISLRRLRGADFSSCMQQRPAVSTLLSRLYQRRMQMLLSPAPQGPSPCRTGSMTLTSIPPAMGGCAENLLFVLLPLDCQLDNLYFSGHQI